jgi:hypothetical protein
MQLAELLGENKGASSVGKDGRGARRDRAAGGEDDNGEGGKEDAGDDDRPKAGPGQKGAEEDEDDGDEDVVANAAEGDGSRVQFRKPKKNKKKPLDPTVFSTAASSKKVCFVACAHIGVENLSVVLLDVRSRSESSRVVFLHASARFRFVPCSRHRQRLPKLVKSNQVSLASEIRSFLLSTTRRCKVVR